MLHIQYIADMWYVISNRNNYYLLNIYINVIRMMLCSIVGPQGTNFFLSKFRD